MLSHVSFGVVALGPALQFYDAALPPLGLVRLWTKEEPPGTPCAAGYGAPGADDILALFPRGHAAPPGAGSRLAFAAPSRQAVDEFFVAALRCGGRGAGAPGLRPHYGPHYYAAF